MTSIKSSKQGFTIIELLTVMSIIIILIGILVPALNKVRVYSKTVAQKGQFHEISKGLEMYRNEHGDAYPDSGPTSATSASTATMTGYCGAMKLCEAMVGQDGMGFHPLSRYVADGTALVNGEPCDLYPLDLCEQRVPSDSDRGSMRERTTYMDAEHVKAVRLQDLYNYAVSGGISLRDSAAFQDDPAVYPNAVITDVFLRANIKITCPGQIGQKAGLPVLYYKADPSKLSHDVNTPLNPDNIYNFDDNYAITMLGSPADTILNTNPHPMYSDIKIFYKAITNTRITSTPKPHNEDGYILLSAGYDGLYGTRDDVFNFTE